MFSFKLKMYNKIANRLLRHLKIFDFTLSYFSASRDYFVLFFFCFLPSILLSSYVTV